MTKPRSDRESEFDRIVHEYYRAIENDQSVDRQQFIDSHPEFQTELVSFFADIENLDLAADSAALAGTIGLDQRRQQDESRQEIGPGKSLTYVGEYRILEEVARGGMGVVFKARQEKLKRTVALKMILSGRFASETEVDRFRREAQSAASLKHPGIVGVHEIGVHDGHHYFTMDYIESESLAARLQRGSLSPQEAARTLKQLAAAIHYAHKEGVLHRDLKPGNVLIDRSGQPHITDFGLAKPFDQPDDATVEELTFSGQILGTPSYMSPEQASAKHQIVSVASDVYSLGAILYACLSGRAPFLAESSIETLRQVISEDPLPLRLLNTGVPKDLETICLKCLEKEPHRRYGTASAFADDLRRFLDGRPVVARPIGRMAKTWRWSRRNPWTAATAVLALVICLASPAFALWESRLRSNSEQNAAWAIEESERADQKARLAEIRKQQAEENLQLANKNAEAERAAKSNLKKSLSRTKFFLARSYWDNGRVQDATRRLEEIPVQDRNLEWHISQREFLGSALTLEGHGGTVTSVVYSPDGTQIASAAQHEIRIWDSDTGELLHLLETANDVSCVAFSDDGKSIYACYDNTFTAWNIESEKMRFSFAEKTPDRREITAFAVDPTRSIVVLGTHVSGGRGKLVFRSLPDGEKQQSIETPHGTRRLRFSPDGSKLGVVGISYGLQMRDSKTGELLWQQLRKPRDFAFHPDGTKVAITEAYMGWSILDINSGSQIQQGRSITELGTGEAQANCIAYGPLGRQLVIGHSAGEIGKIILPSESRIAMRGHHAWISDLAFNHDGTAFASASADQTIKVWRARGTRAFGGGKRLTVNQTAIRTHRHAFLASPLERLLTTLVDVDFGKKGSTFAMTGLSRDVHVGETTGMTLTRRLSGHEDLVTRVAISPDESRLASACIDKTIRLWDLESGRTLKTLHGHRNQISDIVFAESSHKICSADCDGAVRIWNSDGSPNGVYRHRMAVWGLDVCRNGELLGSAGGDGLINIWDIQNRELIHKVKVGRPLLDIQFFPDKPLACVSVLGAPEHETIQIWNWESGELISSFGGSKTVNSLALNHDGTRLFSCARSEVKLWDIDNSQELLEYENSTNATKVVFRPNDSHFALAWTNRHRGSGSFDLPVHTAEVQLFGGMNELSDEVMASTRGSLREPTLDLRAAIVGYKDPFSTLLRLANWLSKAEESDPNFPIALYGFHDSLRLWKQELKDNGTREVEDGYERLLPQIARKIAARYPEPPAKAKSAKPAEAFSRELERWDAIQQIYDDKEPYEKDNVDAVLEETRASTENPLETVAYIGRGMIHPIKLTWLQNRLSQSARTAGHREDAERIIRTALDDLRQGIQQSNPDDWLDLANFAFDNGFKSDAAEAIERHLTLTGRADIVPALGYFSNYFPADDFRTLDRLMISRGFKPSAIEGKHVDGKTMYRGKYKVHDGPYYYYWGITDDYFRTRSDELHELGFSVAIDNPFEGENGKTLHCAIWKRVRLNTRETESD